ncbi:hypothetical protein E5Q_04779 [Mixia osmundae IAM 14324]|uniref:Uncharacterized protein n=1 Tax=Mixia osmundae (strain CBS 9802 / IAM 14324 / JCM 22182 / KY 12970) TaxID=764103 RepID=G7E5I6_MIXOS|nr:hypothetical protein E5Q_04779 [Mixia osmundae IAM 14324]
MAPRFMNPKAMQQNNKQDRVVTAEIIRNSPSCRDLC